MKIRLQFRYTKLTKVFGITFIGIIEQNKCCRLIKLFGIETTLRQQIILLLYLFLQIIRSSLAN